MRRPGAESGPASLRRLAEGRPWRCGGAGAPGWSPSMEKEVARGGGGDSPPRDLLTLDLGQHKKLRTLLCDLSLKSTTGNSVMEKWCAELLCMRVMVYSSVSKWGFPGTISNMKHLRYLKILDSCLCKSLPAGFCRLYNLQIFYAKKWEIDDMPSGFGMLINLQKFESVKCQFHIGLRAADQGQRSKSLPSWFHPHNSEQIHSYDSTGSTSLSLSDVEIRNCRNLSSLEQFLQPAHPTIKKIVISNCLGLESVPSERFGDLHFLEVLEVFNCPMIKSQCLFSPSLKKLHLADSGNLGYMIECSSLTNLDLRAYCIESINLQMWNLPSLQELKICLCPSLRIIKDSSELISTDLSLCGALSHIDKPLVRFLFLTRLSIEHCNRLETIDDLLYLPAIEQIRIFNCGSLSLPTNRLGGFPCLKYLSISFCRSLYWQSGMLLPSSLQTLMLRSCGDFSAWFPSCLENLSSLESLYIEECECIVSIPGHLWMSNLKSLRRLSIVSCPNLKSIGGPDTTAHIKDLRIHDCPELKDIDQLLRIGSTIF